MENRFLMAMILASALLSLTFFPRVSSGGVEVQNITFDSEKKELKIFMSDASSLSVPMQDVCFSIDPGLSRITLLRQTNGACRYTLTISSTGKAIENLCALIFIDNPEGETLFEKKS